MKMFQNSRFSELCFAADGQQHGSERVHNLLLEQADW